MATLKFEATMENGQVIKGLAEIQDKIHQVSEVVSGDGDSIKDTLSNITAGLQMLAEGWSVKNFVSQMMEVRGQFQQTEMAFETMLGSKDKASDLMKQMIQTAATTPFGVTDVTEGAKQLLAFNVSAEQVNDTLIRLGDVAAGMGINLSDMVMLYGTTIAKGKMDTQDLYQHLNRGIPIAESLAKVLGLDVNNAIAEVSKAIKAHKVDADTYIQAMQQMTQEGGKFGGLMAAQSTTITGRIETIKDGVEQMFNELGKQWEDTIGYGLDITGALVENWQKIGKALIPVIATYGAYRTAAILCLAVEKARMAIGLVGSVIKEAAAFISLAGSVRNASEAMALFNMVSSKNVIGAIAAAIGAVVSALFIFNDTVEDTASLTKKFGEEASEASANVETLVNIIKVADTNSQTYKDAIKELSDVYSNYGINLKEIKDDESNLNEVKQEAIDKSYELIEAIKAESIERQRANALAAANENYKGLVEGVSEELSSDLDSFGSNAEAAKLAITTAFNEEELRNIAKKKAALDALGNGLNNTAEKERQLGAAVNSFNMACAQSDEKLRANAKVLGLSESQTEDLIEASHKYAVSMGKGLIVFDNATDAINKSANAMEQFSNSSDSAASRQKAIQQQLQQTGDDVHAVKEHIHELMANYSQNDINFKINFDAEIPSWMMNMDIPELGRLGKVFTSIAADWKAQGFTGGTVNGVYYTVEQAGQRGIDYINAADAKETAEEEKQKREYREQQEALASSKARQNAAKEAKRAAEKAAEDAARRRQQQAEEQREWNEQQAETEQEAATATADLEVARIKNEGERKREENRRQHEKNLQQIEKQADEYRKATFEHNKKLWEINNTDKTKSYEDTAAGKAGWKGLALTKDQQTIIDAANERERLDYTKKQEEATRQALEAEFTAMQDYIKNYGTLQEQKLALDREYAEKRRKILDSSDTYEQKQWQLRALDAQHNADTSKLNLDTFKKTIDWERLFDDMADLTKAQLEGVKQKLTEIMNSGTLQLEEYKEVLDKIRQINGEMSTRGNNPWRTEHSRKRDELERNVADSRDALSAAVTQQSLAKLGEMYQKSVMEQMFKGMGMDVDVNTSTAKDTIGKVAEKYGSESEQVKQATEAYGKLAQSADKVAEANGKVDEATKTLADDESRLHKFLNSLDEALQGFTETMQKVADNLNDLPGLLGELGLDEDSDIMKGAQDLANSANASIDAVKDFQSGNYVGAAMNAISSVKSLGSGFNNILGLGIGKGNAEEINDKIEDLTERNDLLIDAIDRLTEQLADTTGGMKSIQAAQEAMDYQTEKEDNLKEMARLRSTYTAAHHSWAANWGGFTDEQISTFSKKIGREWSGDLWDLTTDEIADLMATPDMVEKIKKTGNEGYANAFIEYLNAWADEAGKMDKIADTLKEKLTQTTFDSLRSDFLNTLMDMDSDAEDFADKFSEMLMQSVLNAKMADLMDDDLQAFYDKWSEYAKSDGKLTEAEIAELRADYDTLTDKALELRDQAAQITGYEGSDSDADSSTGAWSSLGEETGRALEGRFAALQIQTTKIADTLATSVTQNLAIMQEIATTGIANTEATQDIRNMMVMTNSYLEDIAKYNKSIYQEFGKKLDSIKTNTDKL